MGRCICGTREREGGRGRREPQDCVYLLYQLAIKAGGVERGWQGWREGSR